MGSICSSLETHGAGYIEQAQWAVSAPHFGPRELGFMEYTQWAASAPHFRIMKLGAQWAVSAPHLFNMHSRQTQLKRLTF